MNRAQISRRSLLGAAGALAGAAALPNLGRVAKADDTITLNVFVHDNHPFDRRQTDLRSEISQCQTQYDEAKRPRHFPSDSRGQGRRHAGHHLAAGRHGPGTRQNRRAARCDRCRHQSQGRTFARRDRRLLYPVDPEIRRVPRRRRHDWVYLPSGSSSTRRRPSPTIGRGTSSPEAAPSRSRQKPAPNRCDPDPPARRIGVSGRTSSTNSARHAPTPTARRSRSTTTRASPRWNRPNASRGRRRGR